MSRKRLRDVAERGNDVLVLCYHAVSDSWPSELAVAPRDLEEQLQFLLGRGYESTTFTEAVTGGHDRGRRLAVTFDDAYKSVDLVARPILEALEVVGTVFVPSSFATSGANLDWHANDRWVGTEFEPELACMTWNDLERLASHGWEIGSHTKSHPHLTQTSDDVLMSELAGSRAECERQLGRPCTSIAYPYSDHDDRVVEAAKSAGYIAAGTVPTGVGLNVGGSLRFPRVGIYRNDSRTKFRWNVSFPLRRLRQILPAS